MSCRRALLPLLCLSLHPPGHCCRERCGEMQGAQQLRDREQEQGSAAKQGEQEAELGPKAAATALRDPGMTVLVLPDLDNN